MATQSTIYARGTDGANHNAPTVSGPAGAFQHGYEGVGGVNKLVLQPQAAGGGGGGISLNVSPAATNDVEHYTGSPHTYTYSTHCSASGGTAPYTFAWSSSSGESGSGFNGTMHIDATGPNTYQCSCTFTVRDAAGATASGTASEILSLNG